MTDVRIHVSAGAVKILMCPARPINSKLPTI